MEKQLEIDTTTADTALNLTESFLWKYMWDDKLKKVYS
jgi:hypothetical protein